MPFAATWMDLESVILNEVSQTEKEKYHMCGAQLLSLVQLFATPQTVASQAPLSMEILQARTLEWIAMPFSRGSSQHRDRIQVFCIADGFFIDWGTREAQISYDILYM